MPAAPSFDTGACRVALAPATAFSLTGPSLPSPPPSPPRISLPRIAKEGKYILKCRPQTLAINCNSSKFAAIDMNAVLYLYDMQPSSSPSSSTTDSTGGELMKFDRRDVWDVLWSEDSPDLFAMMEKSRMYVFRGLQPEEPVVSSGYLNRFTNLQITCVLMDEVMMSPDEPCKDFVVEFETKALRDTRDLLANPGVSVDDVVKFIQANAHPRLWRTLGERCLQQLDLATADKAFVSSADYNGVQFVKRLRGLPEPALQLAEVAIYFKDFDEAERIYKSIQREDLVQELRCSMGDWFRVAAMPGCSDSMLKQANDNIGQYYFDRQMWLKACDYFKKVQRWDMIAMCFVRLEQWQELRLMAETKIPDTSRELLSTIGNAFKSVGLADDAVFAFLKAGDVALAVEACLSLSQWSLAIQLATQHNQQQINPLLTKAAEQLLTLNKLTTAIELYRRASMHPEAARLLQQLAQEQAQTKAHPLRAKQLFVLAAAEVEAFRIKSFAVEHNTTSTQLGTMALGTMATVGGRAGSTVATVQTLSALMDADSQAQDNKILNNAWHGAEAMHFFMLAQRQFYTGSPTDAMITAMRLKLYEDVLGPDDVSSLIALTSFHAGYYEQVQLALVLGMHVTCTAIHVTCTATQCAV